MRPLITLIKQNCCSKMFDDDTGHMTITSARFELCTKISEISTWSLSYMSVAYISKIQIFSLYQNNTKQSMRTYKEKPQNHAYNPVDKYNNQPTQRLQTTNRIKTERHTQSFGISLLHLCMARSASMTSYKNWYALKCDSV